MEGVERALAGVKVYTGMERVQFQSRRDLPITRWVSFSFLLAQ